MRPVPMRPAAARNGRRHGFTLLELLVVMVIAGIVISLVAVNASPNERGRLLDDGQRIARLFELAQEEAQLRARALAWEGDAGGWRFLVATPNGWQPLTQDVFAPARWRLPPDRVSVLEGGTMERGVARLVFGREPLGDPQRLVLVRGNLRVDIVGDGSGCFSATAP